MTASTSPSPPPNNHQRFANFQNLVGGSKRPDAVSGSGGYCIVQWTLAIGFKASLSTCLGKMMASLNGKALHATTWVVPLDDGSEPSEVWEALRIAVLNSSPREAWSAGDLVSLFYPCKDDGTMGYFVGLVAQPAHGSAAVLPSMP